MEVIKVADYIFDLGPEGGDRGGTIVVEGTPEQVAKHPTSYTAEHLRPIMNFK
jgi:excinuclease ABC subunit A